jgi:hypothetical protein
VPHSNISLVLRSLLFSVRMDGIGPTLKRVWVRLFGTEEWCIFVRPLTPPPTPLRLPVAADGLTVREMTAGDVEPLARCLPFDLLRRPIAERRERLVERLADTVVATRDGRIVGATLYADPAEQPWYDPVAHHIVPPARLTAGIFVVPDEKGAAWAMTKCAGDYLATLGVRTLTSAIRAHNTPAVLMARLAGARMVARRTVRHRFGRRTAVVETVRDEHAFPSRQLNDARACRLPPTSPQ